MSDVPPIHPKNPAGPDPVRGGQPADQTRRSGDKGPVSPAFQVLLERLTARMGELEQKKEGADAPEQISEAMDTARASLEDALSLSEQLLEAFRETERRRGAGEPEQGP
jgi:hypothetical protein